ncbi:MAG: hypothetical protein ACLVIU_04140 [Paraclostridium sp.]
MKIIKIGLILLCTVSLYRCSFFNDKTLNYDKSIFSWDKLSVLEAKENLFDVMEKYEIKTVYQSFSSELPKNKISKFLESCSEYNYQVYYLCGDPEDVLDQDAEKMIENIDDAVAIKEYDNNDVLKGILFDVEPYLLDEWEIQPDKIIQQFADNLQIAYKKAKENKLEMIVCIPYYYDTKGFSDSLDKLIKDGCDGIAIMNYYQKNEYEHIKEEVELAKKYNKTCINIYEFQPSGKYGLTDKNTYYEEGIEKAEENFKVLRNKLDSNNLVLSFHEYKAIKGLMENE